MICRFLYDEWHKRSYNNPRLQEKVSDFTLVDQLTFFLLLFEVTGYSYLLLTFPSNSFIGHNRGKVFTSIIKCSIISTAERLCGKRYNRNCRSQRQQGSGQLNRVSLQSADFSFLKWFTCISCLLSPTSPSFASPRYQVP